MDVIWWITAVLGAVIVNLIASELFTWGPRCSEWITRRAVRRLAPEIRGRMAEEWTGHLHSMPPGLWRIVAGFGFYIAVREINLAWGVRAEEQLNREWAMWTASIKKLDTVLRRKFPEAYVPLQKNSDDMSYILEGLKRAAEILRRADELEKAKEIDSILENLKHAAEILRHADELDKIT
jgi:hypothetical protein